jgi:hypothetical protein
VPIDQQFDRVNCTPESLQVKLASAEASGNVQEQWRLRHLMATAAGCYNYGDLNLHSLVNVQPKRFRDWLYAAWSS